MKAKVRLLAGLLSLTTLSTSVALMTPTASAAGLSSRMGTKLDGAVLTTSDSDVFTIEGNSTEFVLLDHDDEGFFVMTKKYMGAHNLDPDLTVKFDVEDTNNMGYWLNHDFLEYGNTYSDVTYQLPNEIKNHLVEREWVMEATPDYTVTAKVALLSHTEYVKYAKKIGTYDDVDASKGSTWNYWYLRSSTGDIDYSKFGTAFVTPTSLGIVAKDAIETTMKPGNAYGVRPVFYLDNDFFLEVKVQTKTLGGSVADIIKKVYTKQQLESVYGTNVSELYKAFPPEAINVSMFGVAIEGRTIEGSYTYKSSANEPEGNTKFRWLRAKKQAGPYTAIPGATSQNYTVQKADKDCYLKFEVIPESTKQIGKAKRSDPLYDVIMEQTDPYAEDLYIDGEPTVGTNLIARYEYHDTELDIEKGTIVTWQISEDGKNFKNYRSTLKKDYLNLMYDAPAETGIKLPVTENMEGKYLRFAVTPKNDYGTGKKQYSLPTKVIEASPASDKPSIEKSGDVIKMTTTLGDNDLTVWESENNDGEMVVKQKGGSEYKLDGTEKSVRVSLARVTNGGTIGESVYSDKLPVGVQNVSAGKSQVNAGGNVTLKVGDMRYANTITVDISTDENVEIDGVSSNIYIVSKVKSKNGVKLVFTKKLNATATGELGTLETSGSGTIKINSAKAAYKTSDGTFVTKDADVTAEQ